MIRSLRLALPFTLASHTSRISSTLIFLWRHLELTRVETYVAGFRLLVNRTSIEEAETV